MPSVSVPLAFFPSGRRSICLISKMPFLKCVSPNRKIDCVFLFCLLSRAGTILSGGVSTIGPLPSLSSPQHRIISTHFFYFPHCIYFTISCHTQTAPTQSLFWQARKQQACDVQGVDGNDGNGDDGNGDDGNGDNGDGDDGDGDDGDGDDGDGDDGNGNDYFNWKPHTRPPCSCHQTHIWPNAAPAPVHLFGEIENRRVFVCKYICKWWKSSTYRRYESKSLNRHFFLQLRLNSAESHTGGSLIN